METSSEEQAEQSRPNYFSPMEMDFIFISSLLTVQQSLKSSYRNFLFGLWVQKNQRKNLT